MRTLARSTQIVGGILEKISIDSNLTTPAQWITRVGRLFWGLVEISVPRSAAELLGQYWNSLLLLIGVLLIALGLVSGGTSVGGVGWMFVGFAAALFLVRSVLRSSMSATSVWRRVRAVVLILLAVLLAAGLFQTYAWSRQIVERAQTTVSRIVGRS
jgi:hypothetical protein